MMMMTFITQGGEGRGEKIRRGKLRKAKAEALKRGLVALMTLTRKRDDEENGCKVPKCRNRNSATLLKIKITTQ